MMFSRVKHIVFMLLSVLAFVGCDSTIHEYPGENNILLTVRCSVDLSHPEHFVTVECDAEKGTSYVVRTQNVEPYGTRFTEPVCLRYVMDLYRVRSSSTQFVERRVVFADVDDPNPQAIATYQVDASQYKVLVWCDYVQDDVREAWYYQTDDLRRILYSDVEVVDNNDKDAFSNVLEVDLRDYYYLEGDYELVYDLDLNRPKGRYKCRTTDVGDYLNKEDVEVITSVVTYVQYVAAGYNVEEQKPNYFESTRTYLHTVTTEDIDEDGRLEMCYDYVFVNGKQTNVKINFQFYKGVVTMKDGKLYKEDGSIASDDDRISNWSGVVVPLKRNMETIIEGRLLTASFGSGGIGIDPGFEGEIVIPWE